MQFDDDLAFGGGPSRSDRVALQREDRLSKSRIAEPEHSRSHDDGRPRRDGDDCCTFAGEDQLRIVRIERDPLERRSVQLGDEARGPLRPCPGTRLPEGITPSNAPRDRGGAADKRRAHDETESAQDRIPHGQRLFVRWITIGHDAGRILRSPQATIGASGFALRGHR
jgi:hypothetical protein